MNKFTVTKENEAEVMYNMYKSAGGAPDGTWEGTSAATNKLSTVTLKGRTLTVVYDDGDVSTYTDPAE
jgi:hypothetical protein